METLALKDDDRYEMIDGKIVMMSPRPATNHNRIIRNLSILFGTYLKGKRCEAFGDGVDVHLSLIHISSALEKIGEPFFTTKESGTGLGLPICYALARHNQAEIQIATFEEGTTFSLVFQAPLSNAD